MEFDDADDGIVVCDPILGGLEHNAEARLDRFLNEPLKIDAFLTVRVAVAVAVAVAGCRKMM